MRDKLFVFECDEVKLVHQDIRIDGFQKIAVDGKYQFKIYFGMRDSIEVTLSESNAQNLEIQLMAKLQEDLEQDSEIFKSHSKFIKKMTKDKSVKANKR